MLQTRWPVLKDRSGKRQSRGNGLHKGDGIFVVHEFVRADVNALVRVAEVNPSGFRRFLEGGTLLVRSFNSQGIKKFLVLDLKAHGL